MNPHGLELYLCASAKGQQGAALQQYMDLTPFASNIVFDKHARGGYGSMTCQLTMPLIQLEWLYDIGLGLHLEIKDRYLNSAWEGMLYRPDLQSGGAHRSRALDSMTNRVIATYGSSNAQKVVEDSTSQTQYGTKSFRRTLGTEEDATGALNWATTYLAEHKQPTPQINTRAGGRGERVGMNVTGQSYWGTLAWVRYLGRARRFDTARLMRLILQSMESTHGYLSTDYSQIPTTSGITRTARSQKFFTAQQKMIRMLNLGNGSVRYMGGVGAGRRFYVFARPTTVDYFYDGWTDTFRDVGGAVVPKYLLEPGRFVSNILNFDYTRHVSDAKDDPFCAFISSLRYSVDQDRVELEPPDAINILRRTARPASV